MTDVRTAPVTDEGLRDFCSDPRWLHFACLMMRPGIRECMSTLEFTHYPPGTPRNDLFNIHIVHFADLPWVLISIPREEKEFMERAAAASGMRIAEGIPTLLSPKGVELFPVAGAHIFTLENVKGHPVYARHAAKAEGEQQ